MNIQWFGHAAHLIVGQWCQFHLATQVEEFLVSTVGEYLPDESVREIIATSRGVQLEGRGDERRADFIRKAGFVEIGYRRKYESMVFRAGLPCREPGCNCGLPSIAGEELDSESYSEAGEAAKGHMRLIEKWSLMSPASLQATPNDRP